MFSDLDRTLQMNKSPEVRLMYSLWDRISNAHASGYADKYNLTGVITWILEHYHYPRVTELINANNANVERRRAAEARVRELEAELAAHKQREQHRRERIKAQLGTKLKALMGAKSQTNYQ